MGARQQAQTYDGHGYPASVKDWNNVITTTTYDANGLLDQQVEASGTANQRTTTTTWNTALRVPLIRTVTNANNVIISTTQWVYNPAGQALARCEIDPTLSAAVGYTCSNTSTVPVGVRRWTYTYCTAVDATRCPLVGLLLSTTGPRTDLTQTTTYSYYLTGSVTQCGTPGAACYQPGDLKSITDAQAHTTTFASYDSAGRITRRIDPNGVITDYAYTPRGWVKSRIVRANPSGTPSSSDASTTITYTAYGAIATITDPDGIVITYGYDTAHRLITIKDALGNYVQYTLDASGNRTAENTYAVSSSTPSRAIARKFNTLGQLTQITDGLSHVIFDASASGSYDNNGNLVQSIDALAITRKKTYDSLNRLASIIENYNGSDATTKNTTTAQTLDALDHLTGITDPDGLTTTYGYDGLSNATSLQSPDTSTSSNAYDAAGNVLTHTDAKGVVSTSTYDALDRLTGTSYSDSAQTQDNVSYNYDEANSVTGCASSASIGRLTRIVESAVTTAYCYDARGNVTQKRQTQGSQVDTTSYGYTLASRLSSVTSPSQTLTQYSRNALGQISGVSVTRSGAAGQTVVSAINYLPFGPIVSYTLGNGQTLTRSYDANYRLTDLTSPALTLHFALDAAGNIKALGNAPGANPAIETYAYDSLYRLGAVNSPAGTPIEAYTYSKTGDRLSKTSSGLATGAYGYQSGTHWLKTIGNAARTYDANGNTTGSAVAGSTYGFGYNGRNRMTVVQLNGTTVGTYTYNALGQRIAKTATLPQVSSQRFAYDEGRQLIGEYGTINRDYIWMAGLPVAVVDTNGTTSTVNYVHADGLGTPRAISNASGVTQWQWAYQGNPFGEQPPTSSTGYVFNLRFPGQYFNPESGLITNGFRDCYEASTGRYCQSDPTGLHGGMSTYAYVGGDPLDYFDAWGLAQHLGYTTVMPGPGQSTNQDPWQIQWTLSDPSAAGGWIVQQNTITFPDSSQATYWEAWQVAPNATGTMQAAAMSGSGLVPVDDTFDVEPASANVHFHASARFYEGLKLPCDFKPNSNPYAQALPATSADPHLPLSGATPPVVRNWSPH